MRIVIIDDHPIVRRGLEQSISREADLEVVGVAASVAEGVTVATAARANLAIVDLKMPGGGGLELISRCRKKISDCRYIILSSYASYPEVAAAFSCKVEGYILKDVLPEELVSAIRMVAGGKRFYDPRVIDCFLNGTGREPLKRLTGREIEILRCLAKGLNNRDMARKLFITENTIKKHISNILEKLELDDRTQAALFAFSHGLGEEHSNAEFS